MWRFPKSLWIGIDTLFQNGCSSPAALGTIAVDNAGESLADRQRMSGWQVWSRALHPSDRLQPDRKISSGRELTLPPVVSAEMSCLPRRPTSALWSRRQSALELSLSLDPSRRSKSPFWKHITREYMIVERLEEGGSRTRLQSHQRLHLQTRLTTRTSPLTVICITPTRPQRCRTELAWMPSFRITAKGVDTAHLTRLAELDPLVSTPSSKIMSLQRSSRSSGRSLSTHYTDIVTVTRTSRPTTKAPGVGMDMSPSRLRGAGGGAAGIEGAVDWTMSIRLVWIFDHDEIHPRIPKAATTTPYVGHRAKSS